MRKGLPPGKQDAGISPFLTRLSTVHREHPKIAAASFADKSLSDLLAELSKSRALAAN
jgi:hypothetical protein